MKQLVFSFTWLTVAAVGAVATAQVTYEDRADGMRYQVTRSTVQRSVPVTEYQTREQKVYSPQTVTEYQSYQQTYYTPVTNYAVVPHLRNWWNPLGGAYWTHEYVPVTHWEARPATVQIPVAKTNWVEGTQTTQVPVTTYRTGQETHVDERIVGVSPTGASPAANVASTTTSVPAVASRPIGGQQLQGDPPRSQYPWH